MKDHGTLAREALASMKESLSGLTRAPKVLIVDDNYHDCILLKGDLKNVVPDVEVHFAHSGQEASEACAKNKYDVILLDLIFPSGSGAQMLSEPWAKSGAHVIVITGADPGSIQVEDAAKAGAKVIFTKPLLREQISLLLGRNP